MLEYIITLVLQLLTAACALGITLHFLQPKPGWWRLALLAAVQHFAVNVLVFIGDPLPPMALMLLFIAGVCLLCRGPLLARFSIGLLLAVPAIAISALLTNLRPPFDQYMFLIKALIWGGILLLVHKTLPNENRPPLRTPRLWGLIDLLALMPLGSVMAVVTLTQFIYEGVSPDPHYDITHIPNEGMLLLILGLGAVCAIGLLGAVIVLSRHEKLTEEQILWQLRRQYYDNLEQSQQQVRRLRHDMANHLTALSGLEEDARDSYLRELTASPAMRAGVRYCENDIVNALLTAKAPVMETEGIEARLEVRVPQTLTISDVDLCALVANALDNALEANRALPPEKRRLELDIGCEKGFFALRLNNASPGPPRRKHGKIVTSKMDAVNHGFGLTGIEEIVKRYGGTLTVNAWEDRFELLAVIELKSR